MEFLLMLNKFLESSKAFSLTISLSKTEALYQPVPNTTWRVKQLETFHMRALRSILGMCWQDRTTNIEVLDRAECTSIETLLIKAQLRWVGQIIRMDDPLMPRQLLYGELVRVTRTLKKLEASDSDRSQ